MKHLGKCAHILKQFHPLSPYIRAILTSSAYLFTLKIAAVGFSETFVTAYQTRHVKLKW
jgi:hypothetical protein